MSSTHSIEHYLYFTDSSSPADALTSPVRRKLYNRKKRRALRNIQYPQPSSAAASSEDQGDLSSDNSSVAQPYECSLEISTRRKKRPMNRNGSDDQKTDKRFRKMMDHKGQITEHLSKELPIFKKITEAKIRFNKVQAEFKDVQAVFHKVHAELATVQLAAFKRDSCL